MDARLLLWLGLLVGSIAAGAGMVGILVVKRHSEPIAAAVGIAGAAGATAAFMSVVTSYDRADAGLWAAGIMMAAAGGGYALVSGLLENLAQEPPEQQPLSIETSIDGAAAVLVACTEPATYQPKSTATMLQSMADDELIEVSLGTLPFFFFAQKTRYRAIGGASPSVAQLAALAEALEVDLGTLGYSHVDWATCSGDRTLAQRVASAATAGFKRITVIELSVGESLQLSAAKRMVDALRLEDSDVRISYTGALFGSDRIADLIAGRVEALADDPESTGAVLVGHGQPETRSRRNPAFDEQETVFLNRVKLLLMERGFEASHLRIAWSDWHEPDVTSSVRHLAALGCTRVVVAPATYPLDTIGTRLDLEMAVRQARVAEGVAAVTMPAWKDDRAVVAELSERAEGALPA